METYRILTINPGSTSTKLALFENEKPLFEAKAEHNASVMNNFSDINDLLNYLIRDIETTLQAKGCGMDTIDVFVGRGGGLCPVEGGTFLIDSFVVHSAQTSRVNMSGGAPFGPQIAGRFAEKYEKPAYFVNSPDVDEFDELARVTGIPGIYRVSRFHTLNHKETALRDAASLGKKYEDMNYIVAHIGGGVSVGAHFHGRVIDATDLMGGDSPMAPTRTGCLPAVQLADMCFSGKYSRDDIFRIVTHTGGLTAHLGTSEIPDILKMIGEGDEYAALIYNAFIYQIAKYITSMGAVLSGRVDAILLTGGIVFDKDFVDKLTERISFIAPVRVYPGSFEMEVMAAGALRVLRGQEQLKIYTGVPVFTGFDYKKRI